MASEIDRLPFGGADAGPFLNPRGAAARNYLNARNEVKIDVSRTALMSYHLQNSNVRLTEVPDEMMDRVATVLNGARRAGMMVVHQITGFRPGYPEVSPRNKTLSNNKKSGLHPPGTESVEIHPKAAALPEDIVVTGPRFSAFFENDMGSVLRARDITALVLIGISTSGMVSTFAAATDLDYEMVMLEDCCTDRDEVLHRVLFQNLFSRRATVMTAQEFLKAIGVA